MPVHEALSFHSRLDELRLGLRKRACGQSGLAQFADRWHTAIERLGQGILREGDTWCLMLDDEVFLRTTRVGPSRAEHLIMPLPTRLTGGGRSPRILAVLVVNRVR